MYLAMVVLAWRSGLLPKASLVPGAAFIACLVVARRTRRLASSPLGAAWTAWAAWALVRRGDELTVTGRPPRQGRAKGTGPRGRAVVPVAAGIVPVAKRLRQRTDVADRADRVLPRQEGVAQVGGQTAYGECWDVHRNGRQPPGQARGVDPISHPLRPSRVRLARRWGFGSQSRPAAAAPSAHQCPGQAVEPHRRPNSRPTASVTSRIRTWSRWPSLPSSVTRAWGVPRERRR